MSTRSRLSLLLRRYGPVTVGILVLACSGCSQSPPVDQPTADPGRLVLDERFEHLLEKAREYRDSGRIETSLEFYGRAIGLGEPGARRTALSDVLEILDGLHLVTSAGDRQPALPGAPPKHPLQLRVTLRRDGGEIPVSGVGLTSEWISGSGSLVGEQTSDQNGFVTARVSSIASAEQARLKFIIDPSSLQKRIPEIDAESELLLEDALTSLESRAAYFEFVNMETRPKSRVILLIEEKIIDEASEESFVADRMTTALVNQGVRLVGITEIGKSHYEKLEQTLQRDDLVALRGEFFNFCDYVVYGRVHVRRDYENEGGGKWCIARGRISLYSLHGPEILASVDFSEIEGFAGPNQPWLECLEDCFRKTADETVQRLVPLIAQQVND